MSTAPHPASAPAGAPAASSAARPTLLLHAALVVGAVAAAYARTVGAGFVVDDEVSITGNPGLASFAPYPLLEPTSRRIAYLSFKLDHALFGLDPRAFHATNVLLHALAALAVYALARLGLEAAWRRAGRALPSAAPWCAAGAALLFALHPLQTQAVAYVVQRITVLAGLFQVGALALYLAARRPQGSPRARVALLAGAVTAAVLAMRTKENAVTLPFAVLLVEWVLAGGDREGEDPGPAPAHARWRSRLWPTLPFLLLLPLVPLQVALGSRAHVGATASDPTRLETTMSRVEYLATQARVIPRYLRLLLWPAGQNVDWDVPVERGFGSPAVLAGGALVLGLLALGLALAFARGDGARGRPLGPGARLAGTGIVLGFLGLAVESSVFPIADVMFEHRMYLPLAGVALAAAGLATALLEARPALGRPVAGGAAAALVALGAATVVRTGAWLDPVTLWRDAAAKSPNKARTVYNYANALRVAGDLEGAEALWSRTVAIEPDYAPALGQLGALAMIRGELPRAEALLRRAVAANEGGRSPQSFEALYNYAMLLENTGRLAEAVPYYRLFAGVAPPEYAAQARAIRERFGP